MKKIAAAAVFFLFFNGLYAAIGTAGGPAPYLKMGVGARAIALSGAFSPYYDDASCAFWNPASAALLEKISIAAMVSLMTQDRNHNFIGATFPLVYGSFSAGLLNLSVDNLEGRPDYDTSEYYLFSNSDNALIGSYAARINELVSAGAAVKLIFRNIDSVQAWGFSFDAGALLRISEAFSVSAVLADFASYQQWSTGRVEHILLAMRLGAMLSVLDGQLNLSLEAEQLEASELTLKTGAEATLFKIFFLRAGCSYGFTGYYFDYTLGSGLRYSFAGVMLQADYAAVREAFYSSTDINHKLSLSAYF